MFTRINRFAGRFPRLTFVLGSLLILLGASVFRYLTEEPRGIHFIRQTDSLAFVLGYYLFGNPLWEPRVLDLWGAGGKAAAEFPLLYYLEAKWSLLFGWNVLWSRLMNLSFFISGVYALYCLLIRRWSQPFTALILAWLPFVSLMPLYYAISPIPDIPALACALWGICLSERWLEGGKSLHGWLAGLAFALAALFKVTLFVPALALIPALVLSANTLRTRKPWWSLLTMVVLSAIPALLWQLYARQYNQEHGNLYFLSQAAPYWTLDADFISRVWKQIGTYWYRAYFHPDLWNLLYLSVLVLLVFNLRKASFRLRYPLILLVGSLGIFALFFRQYHDHDYYFLAFYPFFALLLPTLWEVLKTYWPKAFHSIWPGLLAVFFLISGIMYSSPRLFDRMREPDQFADGPRLLMGYNARLERLQTGAHEPWIVLGDKTPNGALYFMQRQGRTVPDTSEVWKERMIDMVEKDHYRYALCMPGYDFGSLKTRWHFKQLDSTAGVRIYSLERRD